MLILAADVAAADDQLALAADTDENTGTGDVFRREGDGPVLEGFQLGLDLPETLIGLIGEVVGFGILGFEFVILVAQRLARGALLFGQFLGHTGQLAQAVGVAVGQLDRRVDPLPALTGDLVGNGAQLLVDQAVEERDVLQPAAVFLGEEVAQHRAARCLIGFDADKAGALIGGRNRGLGQHIADLPGLLLPRRADALPDLMLALVVGVDGEGFQHRQRHLVARIGIV